MSNAKRAIMVPVVTLAVCAIAMVGLGFALTTSVTSSGNDTEVLLVDLAGTEAKLGVNGPSGTNSSNEALNFGIKSTKSGTSVTYTVEGGQAFLRIYGNLTGVQLKASVTGGTNITEVGLTLYSTTGDAGSLSIDQKVATLKANGTSSAFKDATNESNDASLSCGTYIVKITSIAGLEYNDAGWSSSSSSVSLTAVNNETLTYVFEAKGGNLTETS